MAKTATATKTAPAATATTGPGFFADALKPMMRVEVKREDVKIEQDRAKLVPLPEVLIFEDAPTRKNGKGRHQIDWSRPEGYAPVMPNIDLLASTGNPYPADVNDATVVTGDRYRPLVKVSMAAWDALKAAGTLKLCDATVDKIIEAAGVPKSGDAGHCVRDTLRDLALYGLADRLICPKTLARVFRVK